MSVKTMDKQRASFIPISASVALFPSKTNACALLNQFQPQEKIGAIFSQKVVESPNLPKIKDAFDFLLSQTLELNALSISYNQCLLRAYCSYSAEDIYAFSLSLPNPKDLLGVQDFPHWIGLYLSALINTSKDKVFTLDFADNARIHCIGTMNKKDIIVNGNAGFHLGMAMRRGSITVNGHADNVGPYMRGGAITVNGDAQSIDEEVYRGKIVVNGNLQEELSAKERKLQSYADFRGILMGYKANVFQYDRQLMKNGQIISQPENK